jgi:hypothetical protein
MRRRYHHPEPQGHQWQMVSQPPYMYPGVMPYLPAMPAPALMRSVSGAHSHPSQHLAAPALIECLRFGGCGHPSRQPAAPAFT